MLQAMSTLEITKLFPSCAKLIYYYFFFLSKNQFAISGKKEAMKRYGNDTGIIQKGSSLL